MSNNELEHNNAESDVYPLDDAAISLLGDIRAQMRILEAQFQGALVLFIRQQKLVGNWQVSDNGREIVRVQQSAHVAMTQ